MNLDHLTDEELIEYVWRHDTDPVRVRLATSMMRLHGGIIDDLYWAGMEDGPLMEFYSEYNGSKYTPGGYIRHLTNELEMTMKELDKVNKELAELQHKTDAMTLAEYIRVLQLQAVEAKSEAKHHEDMRRAAERGRDYAMEQLDAWTTLNE